MPKLRMTSLFASAVAACARCMPALHVTPIVAVPEVQLLHLFPSSNTRAEGWVELAAI